MFEVLFMEIKKFKNLIDLNFRIEFTPAQAYLCTYHHVWGLYGIELCLTGTKKPKKPTLALNSAWRIFSQNFFPRFYCQRISLLKFCYFAISRANFAAITQIRFSQ